MRALRFHEYGEPDVLSVDEVEEPHAGPGQIRIRVQASSVNPIDWKFRAGYLKEMVPLELPEIPGRDAAGVVDEVGEGVADVAVGDAVFGLSSSGGTNAEFTTLTSWAPKPQAWTFEQAAAAGVSGETAARVLNMLGVGPGTTLLVEGGAGGVGSAAVEFAVARGATVIATGSEGNHEFLRSLGAAPTTYGDGLAGRVAALAPDGVDVALDTAGSGSLADLIAIVGDANDVVSIADYTAPAQGARLADASTDPMRALADIAAAGASGTFHPTVTATYPLDQAAAAHAQSQAGHTRGKIVLTS